MGEEDVKEFEERDELQNGESQGKDYDKLNDPQQEEDYSDEGDEPEEEDESVLAAELVLAAGTPIAPQRPEDSKKEKPREEGWFEHYKLTVDPGQKPLRIDVFLTAMIRNQSRTRIKQAAMAGCIRVNRKEVKASYKVRPGDAISFFLPHPPAPEATPEELPLDIHYEDDQIMMINKNPGLVVHPGIGNWTGTMVHGLLHYLNKDVLDDKKKWMKPLLVHRIDKDTSGLLVVAKTDFAHANLSAQFFRRVTERIYYALVWGDFEEDSGRVEGHVGRSNHDRKQFVVYPDGSKGKYAITNYEILERFHFATLVKCKLETGRTHQIRVHMRHLGHTLFGDHFYGGDVPLVKMETPKYNEFIRNCLVEMPRQALHAKTLGFRHPTTELRSFFECELPEDFKEVIRRMRNYRDAYLK